MSHKIKCTVIEKLILDGWFTDEKEALPWVISGDILVNNQRIYSLKEKILLNDEIRIKEYYKKRYVNKGGLKLEGALNDFKIDIKHKIALDCGASTGGFTDCLIEHGADLVYAVDVGFGQLVGKLLLNEKVVNMEKTNLSDECLLNLAPNPEIITLDLSYLSLKEALPICINILKGKGNIIALIKPIFEVDSKETRRTGQINDKDLIKKILIDLCNYFLNNNFNILGITNSPIKGNNGTLEYFAYINFGENQIENINNSYNKYIEVALEKSFLLDDFDKNNYKIIKKI